MSILPRRTDNTPQPRRDALASVIPADVLRNLDNPLRRSLMLRRCCPVGSGRVS